MDKDFLHDFAFDYRVQTKVRSKYSGSVGNLGKKEMTGGEAAMCSAKLTRTHQFRGSLFSSSAHNAMVHDAKK